MKLYFGFILARIEGRRRILSNSKEKKDYISLCPSPLKELMGNCKGNIKVSEIYSKKIFKLWSKMLKSKKKFQLPEVNSPFPQDQDSSSNSSSDDNWFIESNLSKARVWNQRKFELNQTMNDQQSEFEWEKCSKYDQLNFTSERHIDREECQTNYRAVNERIRDKMIITRDNMHHLFTFNSLRLKSPLQRSRK